MTDRPVNEIRPGDRVYLSGSVGEGSILEVEGLEANGKSWTTTLDVTVWPSDNPLRILQPGDVIPANTEYGYVQPDGKIRSSGMIINGTHFVNGGHCVILSMPTPEPSREEQREKLVKAYNKAMLDVGNAHDSWLASDVGDRELVEAVRVFGEALDALEKFDAETEAFEARS